MSENYNPVINALLPNGCDFFYDQKKALLADGNFNVVAGPGSGKTTVLTAKLALLLLKRRETDKGICLITHTNVAVEEVVLGLRKIGIKSVEYPNFVGTIQEFFNHFFAIKAFNILNKEKNIRILSDEEYKSKLDPIFRKKVAWFNPGYNIPSFKKNNVVLNVNDNEVFFSSNAPDSYKNQYNQCFNTLFHWGVVTNQQCLELSKWYIESNVCLIKRAFSNRFSHLLLDEAQDTSFLQYSLLELLTDTSEINFQKYGDPYQSLYSIYGEENIDAWSPYNEVDRGFQIEEIAETSRFGNNIAKIVKAVCLEPYEGFKSLNIIDSFNPHFLTFESKDELLEKYKSAIKHYENENIDFKNCKNKDVIVSDMHDNLKRYFPEYSKESSKNSAIEYSYEWIYNYIILMLSSIFELNVKDMKLLLSENLEMKILISRMIAELNVQTISRERIEQILKYITRERLDHMKIVEVSLMMIDMVSKVKEGYFKGIDNDIFYKLSTIHGVKGETHRSTLLIIDSYLNYNKNSHENKYLKRIKPFLIGQRVDYNGTDREEEFKKVLKLTYVALSRPNYLAIIALPKKEIDETFRESLIAYNWKEIEIS